MVYDTEALLTNEYNYIYGWSGGNLDINTTHHEYKVNILFNDNSVGTYGKGTAETLTNTDLYYMDPGIHNLPQSPLYTYR